jgi:hypothetical protein
MALIQICPKNLKNHFETTTFMTVLRQSRAVFCRNLRICDLQNKLKKLWIRDLRTGTPKNLRIVICGLFKKVCLPTSAF